MSGDSFGGRYGGQPYLDTVTVPSVLVMPGDPWPAEFYARYPHAFRLPVRIVWRRGASGQNAPSPPPAAVMPAQARGGGNGRAVPGNMTGEGSGPGVAAPGPAAGPVHGGGDPVATFLRVNDALDRRQGKPAPAPSAPQIGPDGKPQDPNTSVPFMDDNGKAVLAPNGKAMYGKAMDRPAGADPHFFVEQGLKDREAIMKILSESPSFEGLAIYGPESPTIGYDVNHNTPTTRNIIRYSGGYLKGM